MARAYEGQPFTVHEHAIGGQRLYAAVGTCRCKATTATVNLTRDLPPDQVLKKFQQRGLFASRGEFTAACCRNRKEMLQMSNSAKVINGQQSPEAMKAQRQVFALLETYFDEKQGRYSNSYSDQRIATETGASVAFVAEIRTTCFGVLKPPSELEQLQADIAAIEAMVRDLRSRVDKALNVYR